MSQLFSKIYLFSTEHKAQARTLIAQAVTNKNIVVPARCECCFYDASMLREEESILNLKNRTKSKKTMLEAHHYNYNYPLSVWWLCPLCHRMLHIIQRRLKIACINLVAARQLIDNYRYDYEHSWIEDIDDNDGLYEELFF